MPLFDTISPQSFNAICLEFLDVTSVPHILALARQFPTYLVPLTPLAACVAMAEVEIAESGGLARTLKDLLAGAAGGVAQVLLGQFALSDVAIDRGFCCIAVVRYE